MNPPKADPSASKPARGTDQWPIFVLSLEGDDDRRAPLLKSLAEMGFEAEVLIGVDGRDGLPDWAEAEVNRDWNWSVERPRRPMTDGELACALSHARAYRKIIDEDLPGAIVFEDDAIIGERFKPFVTARGYEAGEMVLLGHEETWVRPFSEKRLCNGVNSYRIVNAPVLAHGYCISQTAASYIVRKATPVRAPADWPCDISRLNSLAVFPHIAMQPPDRKAKSHLEAERVSANRQKRMQKKQSRYFSIIYLTRILRKRFNLPRMRRLLGRRIA